MTAEFSTPRPEPLELNREVLRPGLSAPIPLAPNPRSTLQSVLRDMLIRQRVPPVLVEPAALNGGAVLHGCQEFIGGCNDLIASSEEPAAARACRRILTGCRSLSGSLEGIYALHQAVEDIPEAPPPGGEPAPPCSRLKNLAAPLERWFESGAVPTRMDLERLALLQVRLDDLYDQACRQLERFYQAVIERESAPLLARLGRGLYRDLTQRMVPEHIFDIARQVPAGGEARTGLLDLLPELEESF